jgi:uncharacterized damage-inducible protein DinB
MKDNSDIKYEIKRISNQLGDFYTGNSWVTDNVSNRVFPITSFAAFKKISGHHHSIAELMCHIIAWRNFAIQKLTGNNEYDIEDNSIADWPVPVEWDTVQNEFEVCHHNLLNAIENFAIEQWHSKVPRRNYTYLFLINGIVQHDYYHYGQIASLLAALKKLDDK